jgi:hypothetical protein
VQTGEWRKPLANLGRILAVNPGKSTVVVISHEPENDQFALGVWRVCHLGVLRPHGSPWMWAGVPPERA